MPDAVERMAKIAMTPVGGDPAKFGQLVTSEYARYGNIVREFGIQAE